jgi:NTP pyrophosphatase (non-canonical NTP hydrolase)
MTKGLNELRDEAHANAVAHGFKDASVGEELMLIVSELSEALEDYRAGKLVHETVYEDAGNRVWTAAEIEALRKDGQFQVGRFKPCGIPSELADVIIRVLDFSGKHGVDIEKAVIEKMAYNVTRPHRHGGKVL